MFNNYSITNVRRLVDKYFSLQWCRDNFVVPLSIKKESSSEIQTVIIAIANYSYLGTISEPIKERLNQSGQKCFFVEKTQDEIQEILDKASEENFISDEVNESIFFEDDYLSESIRTTSDKKVEEFIFEFDEDIVLDMGRKILDLVPEMMESKIKKAVGFVLIYSKYEKVSDIYIDPKEDSYKIRLRKEGVSQKFISMPKESGIKFLACLKEMSNMDVTEKGKNQDGKILRKFDGQKLELSCNSKPGLNGESMALKFLNSDSSTLNLDNLIHIETVLNDFAKNSIKIGNLNL
ncbi:ATPase, T2SS/T4P/T4SS family [Prochlorococcus marinus]|uniref:ATPase, T2SS/T4P/T4SS family n=1 Tax=Prochlorococcus marinus TaxID=1219 RepID=UPI001ADB1C29|nr:ATPase, T2SS/T4P/T4SS family [Prochlorococcus marinus]MBO8204237.1 Flp pilus assembly complex ATPase component TadA [Prochlorococcus marinus CUG1415]MBW3043538.1 hypothetical protein [Prochlorococcus marinus str. MU1415]